MEKKNLSESRAYTGGSQALFEGDDADGDFDPEYPATGQMHQAMTVPPHVNRDILN